MDDYPLLSVFWTMLWFFLWVMWLFLLFKVLMDVFRDHEMNGWKKAAWLVFCIVLPYIGVLVYIIARGKGMSRREVERARAGEAAFKEYVREAAGTGSGERQPSRAEELATLADLKEKGALTDEEFRAAKEKLLT